MSSRQPHGRQPRPLIDAACQHLPECSLGLLRVPQRLGDAQPLGNASQSKHGPHRESLLNVQVFSNAAKIRQIALVLECQANRFNLLVGTAGEVGDGAMPRPAIVPVGFADEVGRVRFSVDGFVNGVESHGVCVIYDRTEI